MTEEPREITVQDGVNAFLATGCPNTESPDWLHQPDQALYEMMVYCVKTKDGTADQRQRDRCCGTGVDCTPEFCKL
eukprot:Awhi_evm2s5337